MYWLKQTQHLKAMKFLNYYFLLLTVINLLFASLANRRVGKLFWKLIIIRKKQKLTNNNEFFECEVLWFEVIINFWLPLFDFYELFRVILFIIVFATVIDEVVLLWLFLSNIAHTYCRKVRMFLCSMKYCASSYNTIHNCLFMSNKCSSMNLYLYVICSHRSLSKNQSERKPYNHSSQKKPR